MSLYENIHAKRRRIARGSGERMRKKGEKGAPTDKHLSKQKELAKKKWLKSYTVRCDRNIVITRYIGA